MKPLIPLFLFLTSSVYAQTTIKAWATRVYDGDTLTIVQVEDNQCKGIYKIRLQGIDAPELKQSYGKAARRYAMRFAFGRLLTVTLVEKEKYGRWVGKVCHGSSPYMCLNYRLVREGYAWHYAAFSDDARLARAEAKARAEKIRLWRQEDPTAPWIYRKQQSEK